MSLIALNPAVNSWCFTLDNSANPCSCCDAPRAMDHMDGYWHCDQQNRTWLVITAQSLNPFHSIEECVGNCELHSLMDDTVFSMLHAEAFGISWGDLIIADELAMRSAETPEELAARMASEAANELARTLAIKAAEMERYARLKAQTNTEVIKTDRGKFTRIRKIQEPCKWLYLDEKAPKHEWRRTRTGKMEPPYRPHLSGAECWAFEYHDPKTGKLQIKHTCDHLHPGEEGWHEEWNTDGRWRPAAAETRDFSSLAGSCASRTPSRCSDSASTVSAASSYSHRSAPGAPRKAPPPPQRSYERKKTSTGFHVLALDDSD